MKILHCCLSCFYIDGYGYQENILPVVNQQDGHDVMIIASSETYNSGKQVYVEPNRYQTETGIPIIRVRYSSVFPAKMAKKIRKFPNFVDELLAFSPDVIMFHGTCGYELLTVAKYKAKNPTVKLYVDSHEDFHNSARTWLSRNTLYRLIYKPILKRSCGYIDKVYCVSIESEEFCNEFLNIPSDIIEWYPLGGIPVSKDERKLISQDIRNREKVSDDSIVFIHSGKMNKHKRTKDIIEAFSTVEDSRFRLWIIGILLDDVQEEIQELIEKDSRISFLGWKESDELMKYLCASDFYVQPGGQSATMQNAMCCGCAVMLYPHKSHEPFVDGNGYYVSTVDDMKKAFLQIKQNHQLVAQMKERSYEIACDLLDYNKQAKKIT